jgi:hypothetical protein
VIALRETRPRRASDPDDRFHGFASAARYRKGDFWIVRGRRRRAIVS